MEKRCCFLIGHRETTDALYPALYDAVVRHMVVYDVGEFVVGQYGGFDRLAARALHDVKGRFPGIRLTLLLAYHPAERGAALPDGFDGTFYPPGLETAPRRVAIVRANAYMAAHADCVIAGVWHPASNAARAVDCARRHRVPVTIVQEPCLLP